MATWIFKCDPKLYRLSDRLSDPNNMISWLVTKYRNEIQPSDMVFLMETGPKRAILAVMRVDEAPQEREELESEQTYWVSRDTERRCRVLGTITKRVDLPIEELKGVEGLEHLSILEGFQQGTNFKVTEAEAEILLKMV
jgi:EVE domain